MSEPSGTVRRVVYLVAGGEKTLKALAAEAGANEARYRSHSQCFAFRAGVKQIFGPL